MKADPKVTPSQGKVYKLDFTLFRGTDKRFQAFEAGELDIATGSSHSVLMAASEGARFKIVATLSREGASGFSTRYMVKADSPIKSIADLKGRTACDLHARIAARRSLGSGFLALEACAIAARRTARNRSRSRRDRDPASR